MRPSVAFILGTGHCGSTLLDLILSSHSRAFGLGEVKHLARIDLSSEQAFSDLNGHEDAFWTRETLEALQRFLPRPAKPRAQILRRLLPSGRRDRFELYRYLFDRTGAALLVDSSKSLSWLRQFLEQNRPGIEPFVIFLERDARAVVNSYRRKYPERDLEALARHHRRHLDKLQGFFRRYEGAKARIAYESLATDPEATTRLLCRFLRLEYEPGMLEFWRFEHHQIGGNAGPRSLVKRFHDEHDARLFDDRHDDRHRSHYTAHELGIRLDERWKAELTPEQIRLVTAVVSGCE